LKLRLQKSARAERGVHIVKRARAGCAKARLKIKSFDVVKELVNVLRQRFLVSMCVRVDTKDWDVITRKLSPAIGFDQVYSTRQLIATQDGKMGPVPSAE
jgi:hypothetical protein